VIVPRASTTADIEPLARLWHEGWQDAHAKIVPDALARQRTYPRFRERMERHLPGVRVVDDELGPAGFSLCKADELNQLYVHRRVRGSGLARTLVEDAERRLALAGVERAWLACAIGNMRAARFYEKMGWALAGVFESVLQLPDGPFALDVWRYEKDFAPAADA
jgi:GNAT superfamily N-acetyltransferase